MSATSRRNVQGQWPASGIGRAAAPQLARGGAETVEQIAAGRTASFVAADAGAAERTPQIRREPPK